MLTGRPAVTGDDPAAVLASSRMAGPGISGLPPVIGAVIAKAMAPDPADRYPDAASFRDALDAVDAPVDPEAPTAVVPVPGPVPEGRLPSVTVDPRRAAVLGAGLAAALIVLVALARPAAPATPGSADARAGQASLPAATPASPSFDASLAPAVAPPHGNHGNGRGNGNGKGKD
jgi:serine/threonine-protein kinase